MKEFEEYEKGIVADFLKGKTFKITTTGKGKKRDKVYELAVAFDIETTSAYFDNINYEYYRTNDVTDAQKEVFEKRSWMYIWQMAINDFSFYGRTWKEFIDAIHEIKTVLNKATVIIYVHNLSYEFQFISKLFTWKNIFAVDKRKTLYARTIDGVCFKCAYFESGVGLAKLSEDLETKKLVGDLDYKVLRISKTQLTKDELAYCQNDVLILTEYVNKKMKETGSIANIQLTKTGYVREWCRDYCLKSQNYRKKISQLTMTVPEYEMLKAAFAGGFTHASAHNAGVVFDNVRSHDITSSYPSVMCCELYPMSSGKFVKLTTPDEFKELCRTKLCVFEIELKKVKARTIIDNIISKSKCFISRNEKQLKCCVNPVEDNGRIVFADRLCMTLTNIDFFQLQKFYTWENLSVGKMIIYEPGFLPKRFIECILHFYKQKTVLKDVVGREVDYALYKSMLNSIYGMVVMDIVRDVWQYQNEWTTEPQNKYKIMKQYNDSENRFMFYAWGVFVTAYARRNVQNAILSLGDDYIYTDTDSVKFVNPEKHTEWFEEYDRKIDEKMKRVCELYMFDFDDTRPKDIYGEKHPLGYFDMECDYAKFKTLGAKRYMVEMATGERKTTIAGVGKKAGKEFFKTFDEFRIGAFLPAGKTGKQLLSYIDNPPEEMWVYDEYGNSEFIETITPSIHMEDVGYKMTATEDYERLLNMNNEEILIL